MQQTKLEKQKSVEQNMLDYPEDFPKNNEDSHQSIEKFSFHKQQYFEIETPNESKNLFQRLEAKFPKFISYYYMLFSAFMMACNALMAKYTQEIPPFQTLFWRSIFILIILWIHRKIDDVPVMDKKVKEKRKLILFIIFISFLQSWGYFQGIACMPLSEAITLMYTNPMFTGLLAYILVKERYTFLEIISAIVSLVGVILILRPEFIFGDNPISTDEYNQNTRLLGALVCLLGSFILSLSGILMKKTGNYRIQPTQIMTIQTVITFIISPILWLIIEFGILGKRVLPSWWEIFLIILMALSYFLGQYFIIKGMQLSVKTVTNSYLNYIQMIFAYIFDIFAIQDTPETMSYIGSVLVVFSCVFIIFQSQKS